MHPQADPAPRSFSSPAFAAFHAKRCDELRRRAIALCTGNWDVNDAHLLMHDARSLLAQSQRSAYEPDVAALTDLIQALQAVLALPHLPDAEQREEILSRLGAICASRAGAPPSRLTVLHRENERIEVPVPGFWRRWVGDAPAATYSDPESPAPAHAAPPHDSLELSPLDLDSTDIDAMLASGQVSSSLEIVQERIASDALQPGIRLAPSPPQTRALHFDWGEGASRTLPTADQPVAADTGLSPPGQDLARATPPPPAHPPEAAVSLPLAVGPQRPEASDAAMSASGATAMASASQVAASPSISGVGRRIYHLTQSGALACALDQRLEQLGYELELLDNADDLKEVLGALTPNLIIIDAEFQDALEDIGAVLQAARKRAFEPIWLLALCQEDSLPVRLTAHRAGVDALLRTPSNPMPIIARIEQLIQGRSEAGYRILIVEDDQAQGLFAESVLRNAGMEAEVVIDGLKVMQALERFQPDLILMDLYLPDCNGAELTALIRERPEFIHTPIVFLSGEVNQDKHLEALSAGGDDFLSKPVRPRHLIATITNRIQRARSLRQHAQSAAVPATEASAAVSAPVAEGRPVASGLLPRAALLERLEQALHQAGPAQRRGGVLLVQPEGMSGLHQGSGSTASEGRLQALTQRILARLDPDQIACRHGNSGILIFAPEAGPEQLNLAVTRLRQTLAVHTTEASEQGEPLRAHVAACDLCDAFSDAESVLDAVERAALAQTVPPTLRGSSAQKQPEPVDSSQAEIDTLLIDAVTAGRLELDFQPITALQGGGRPQYQALLRLRSPQGQLYLAAEVLPRAHAHGCLPELDRWVLARALEVARESFSYSKPVTLFVSQSIQALTQPGHGDWIASRLRDQPALGECLVLEINAEQAGPQLDLVQAICTQLSPLGLRFCLSRYRGSEAQTKVLHALPLDLVKVAPELLTQLGNHKARAHFTELVEHLHARGTGVIAPRVEDARTAATLWMSGIDYIQGNLVQSARRSLDYDFNAAVL